MSTVFHVRRFIADLPPQTIFVTRELLTFGDRKSIDWLTCILVRRETILRLARGVFVRNDVGMELPSLLQIAEAKARAFGKLIIPTLENLAKKRDLKKPSKVDRRVKEIPDYAGVAQFSVIGCKGNFHTEHGRVTFKSIAPRKFFLHQEKVGKTILAMWHATERAEYCSVRLQNYEQFNREEKKRVKELSAWAPSWLHFYLYPREARADIHAPWSIFPMLNKRPTEENPSPFVQESGAFYTLKRNARKGRHRLHLLPTSSFRALNYLRSSAGTERPECVLQI